MRNKPIHILICWCWARDGSSPKFGNKKKEKRSLSLERRDAEEKNEKKFFVAVFSTERKGEEREREREVEGERDRRR
jgi:hypothetical protein